METLAQVQLQQHLNTFEADLQQRVEVLERKSREMDESIRYAGLIQQSILPNPRIFMNTFRDAFVFFQPKDIVGGDFYWIYLHGNDIYFAVGDCTGHGVPGAIVNIAGNTILRNVIRREGFSAPDQIVRQLDSELSNLFNEHLTSGITRDGMEIAFCKFNLSTGKGQFCGAGRPLLLVRNGALIEFKKGNSSIGYNGENDKDFYNEEFELQKGDQFYLFSDGYTDQFGGENIKKFNRRRFRNMLQSISNYPMERQHKELKLAYSNWKGQTEQIDDVCVLGVTI